MIFPDRGYVQRPVSSGPSSSGQPAIILSTVIASLKCDVQPDTSMVSVPQSGQTTISYKKVFCNSQDIREKDVFTQLCTATETYTTTATSGVVATVTVVQSDMFSADVSVYDYAVPTVPVLLTKVTGTLRTNEYSVSAGVYAFHDAGIVALIRYTYKSLPYLITNVNSFGLLKHIEFKCESGVL